MARPKINHRASEFTEMTVVINGALGQTEVFTSDHHLEAAIHDLKIEWEGRPEVVEVYLLEHRHSIKIAECTCSQYLTDHQPDYTFGNTEEE